jgi:hypothetical protein
MNTTPAASNVARSFSTVEILASRPVSNCNEHGFPPRPFLAVGVLRLECVHAGPKEEPRPAAPRPAQADRPRLRKNAQIGVHPKLHQYVPPQARWTPWSTGTRSKLGMTVVIGRNAPPDVIVRETWAVGAKGASQRLGAGLDVKRRYVRIPRQSGRGFRFDVGHRSDLIPATIPK